MTRRIQTNIFLTLSLIFIILSPFSSKKGLFSEQQQLDNQEKLSQILRKTRDYCRRLEKAALDFVCREEVSERIDNSKDSTEGIVEMHTPYPGEWISHYHFPRKIEKNSYVYDYQYIRKSDRHIERRTLLEENGKKKYEEDALLKTTMFRVQNVLFGPIGLLSESQQHNYQYQIIKEELVNGEKAVVLEAVPKSLSQQGHCFGKIWVKEDDSSILKIEWNQKSLGNYQIAEQIASKYKAKPQIISISEYGLEKNGIRFPSGDMTEEAYILQNGKKFIRSETIILFKNYKFFTVETEVKYGF
jgi:hypothetical protein